MFPYCCAKTAHKQAKELLPRQITFVDGESACWHFLGLTNLAQSTSGY